MNISRRKPLNLIALLAGVAMAFVGHELYRMTRSVTSQYDAWLGYSHGARYSSLTTAGSPGKVHEMMINGEKVGERLAYSLGFTPFRGSFPMQISYTPDSLDGNAMIHTGGPVGIKYADYRGGRVLSLSCSARTTVCEYHDYDGNGTLDCVCEQANGRLVLCWLMMGDKCVPVENMPKKDEDGALRATDGSNAYIFLAGVWKIQG